MGAEVDGQRPGQPERASGASAVVAGLGVGILPAALVLLLYLPARLALEALTWGPSRRRCRAPAGDPAFEQYLARRACRRAAVGLACAPISAGPVAATSAAASAGRSPTPS